MYPKMNLVRGIVSVLLYHKRKVAKGLAECLLARNFLKEAPDLAIRAVRNLLFPSSFAQRIARQDPPSFQQVAKMP